MDISQQRRQLLFSNLLLLGFDTEYMERKYTISFNRDMFIVPNKKAFEVVTHFLFTKLNSVTSQDYTVPWPLCDKKQDQEFRKTCFTHLIKISKDDTVTVRFPHILQTTLLSPGGERFYELYLAFSLYILQKTIAKDGICHIMHRPSITSENHHQVKEILQSATIDSMKEFLKVQKQNLYCEQKWQDTAEQFVSFYRQRKQKILELKKCIEESSSLCSLWSNSGKDDSLSDSEKFQEMCDKSNTELSKLLHVCHGIEKLLLTDKLLWDVVRTELKSECPEQFILDGRKYNTFIPEELAITCKNELQERRIQSLSQDGKLSIQSFLGACCVSLDYYKDTFQRVGFPTFKVILDKLKSDAQQLEQCLNSCKSLSQKIAVDVLPNVTKSLGELEAFVYPRITDDEEQSDLVLHSTPTLTFSPALSPSSSISSEDALYIFTPPTSEALKQVLRPFSRRKSQHQISSPLVFISHESAENHGHLVPNRNFNSSLLSSLPRKQSSRIPISSSNIKQNVDLYTSAKNSDKSELSQLSSNLTVCNMLQEDEKDCSARTSFELSDSYLPNVNRLSDTFNIFSPPFDEKSNHKNRNHSTLQKVKSDFVQQVVKHVSEVNHNNTYSDETDLLVHLENSSDSPDFIGHKAFCSHEKLARSPLTSNFDITSTHQLSRLSYQLHSADDDNDLSINYIDDSQRTPTEDHNFEYEDLDDITLPSVPIY